MVTTFAPERLAIVNLNRWLTACYPLCLSPLLPFIYVIYKLLAINALPIATHGKPE
ncbi:hypothetical protein [Dictyobacter formicarum]|uniref:hypothetical protein n=1 Tax=Dictyobacter formicarum TaxID=2778368 RepID=UPI0019159E81|nr:hypothetical protein [Dictyobacter formicarum]